LWASRDRSDQATRHRVDQAGELFGIACTVLAAWFPASPPWRSSLTGWRWPVGRYLVAVAEVDQRTGRPKQPRDHARGAWLLPNVAPGGLVVSASGIGLRQNPPPPPVTRIPRSLSLSLTLRIIDDIPNYLLCVHAILVDGHSVWVAAVRDGNQQIILTPTASLHVSALF
jgi:hypothetical protein